MKKMLYMLLGILVLMVPLTAMGGGYEVVCGTDGETGDPGGGDLSPKAIITFPVIYFQLFDSYLFANTHLRVLQSYKYQMMSSVLLSRESQSIGILHQSFCAKCTKSSRYLYGRMWK